MRYLIYSLAEVSEVQLFFLIALACQIRVVLNIPITILQLRAVHLDFDHIGYSQTNVRRISDQVFEHTSKQASRSKLKHLLVN